MKTTQLFTFVNCLSRQALSFSLLFVLLTPGSALPQTALPKAPSLTKTDLQAVRTFISLKDQFEELCRKPNKTSTDITNLKQKATALKNGLPTFQNALRTVIGKLRNDGLLGAKLDAAAQEMLAQSQPALGLLSRKGGASKMMENLTLLSTSSFNADVDKLVAGSSSSGGAPEGAQPLFWGLAYASVVCAPKAAVHIACMVTPGNGTMDCLAEDKAVGECIKEACGGSLDNC